MTDIVKTCKIHGKLTIDKVFHDGLSQLTKKQQYRCKICTKINRNKYISGLTIEEKRKRAKIYDERRKKYDGSKESLTGFKYRLKKFNMTLEKYEEMVKNQNNCCFICLNPETRKAYKKKKITKLCIDHCHNTGKVRALLCWSCNGMLGMVKDSIPILESAIEYLKKFK